MDILEKSKPAQNYESRKQVLMVSYNQALMPYGTPVVFCFVLFVLLSWDVDLNGIRFENISLFFFEYSFWGYIWYLFLSSY